MTMKSTIKQIIRAAADVVLPRTCPVCGQALNASERWLCVGCLADMPLTHLHTKPSNDMEQLFYGKTPMPIDKAAGYFWYEKSSPYSAIIHDIKYRHMPRMGMWLAYRAASGMTDFFSDIDIIVPVPLHFTKLAQRGYNQSLYIARGIAQACGAQVVEALKATRSHSTQTRKGAYDRWKNIAGAYALAPAAAHKLQDRHVLIVDDVVTTGSTLEVCAAQVQTLPGVKVSLFTLAVARLG